mgnify:CR=1 FL=1
MNLRIALALAFSLALPTLAAAQTAPKKEWLEHVEKNMPVAFCTQQAYFRQCFNVTVQECEAAATSATRDCIDKHGPDVPSSLALPRDGQRWGGVIGKCAGTATELSMMKKRINSARCNDPKQWQ